MDYSNALPPNKGGNGNGNGGGLGAFDSAEPAPEFTPLPPGIYQARVQRGDYTSTKSGAEAFRLKFEITEGEHAGRTVQRTWTFSEKALPYTRRDLAAFGLTTKEQILSPFPPPGKEIRCRLVVAVQNNNGTEFNDIKRTDNVTVTDSPLADLLLHDNSEGGTSTPTTLFDNPPTTKLPD